MVRKLQPLQHASRLEVAVEGLKLQLLAKADPPETMVTAAISGLSLALSRNQDLSGEAPFQHAHVPRLIFTSFSLFCLL